uniref:FAD-binding PCMH-type domain-containing protein n=1 Tax=Chromera velia CCMP2878 TaxID=1169474 RepID=A0A0G4HWV1_9ALVE|mmetsp:Transcript_50231/g.98911  ORF Transcript_50231/g.98911 Transcript_50231/m.98911 type:complete len:497 (+) Transcript_50231:127-1617(+)|eukprot:Cvel_9119.t1-p1 / transcript=Cvel_9119.t1 / gene=Cvel_9119 / organism=Chromera_velia_CCMP2878 / gene_product=L-gulonolactone oxidase, putative / transcript_product=L-gulonolactone oxidase, putative / location=Cvel_scaffold518:26915-28402(+) / protein_length=496 / sequence_SO=supercontig / SO=protein_coding / is_pseudo=false
MTFSFRAAAIVLGLTCCWADPLSLESGLSSPISVFPASISYGLHFSTWDGRKSCRPREYRVAKAEEDVVEIIQRVAKEGEKVKVIGAGLSFSGVQLADDDVGVMLSLDGMNRILSVKGTQVEVEAGIRLRDLCERLAADHGLALPNLGATATQSIVGAASTGTHGTGTELGAIATQIVRLRVVDGKGGVHETSETEDAELFRAARVGVGAVGVITRVTLQAVPLWKMQFTSFPYSLTNLLKDLPNLMSQYKRLQWSFTPFSDNATVLVREDVPWDTPIDPPGPDGGCWSKTQPTRPTCTDLSYKTLTDSQQQYKSRKLYTEMEMFVPVEDSRKAIEDYVAWIDTVRDQHDPAVSVSVMVRYVASDDIFLSPMSGRDTAVLSVIVAGDRQQSGDPGEFESFSKGLQGVCETKYKGRPHWGKVNWTRLTGQSWENQNLFLREEKTPEYLRRAYGEENWDRFQKVMQRMDPQGMFVNSYLRERFFANEERIQRNSVIVE